MTIFEAIHVRHAVRSYLDRAIPADVIAVLQGEIDDCNREGDLHIQLVTNEPKAFDGMMAHYGKFSGVQNYIALVGPKGSDLEEKCGYYGERLVLLAQMLGLNTCWVAMTHGKSTAEIAGGEKQTCLIALGYGKTQGVAHKSKPMTELAKADATMPDWFCKGMEAVMLAPTATNQQKFLFELHGDAVTAKVSGFGFYSGMDLGIVKYHFEAATGKRVG